MQGDNQELLCRAASSRPGATGYPEWWRLDGEPRVEVGYRVVERRTHSGARMVELDGRVLPL